jgi:hypothetical protein
LSLDNGSLVGRAGYYGLMNNAAEFTYPLIGFTYGRKTDIAKRVLNNKDAALLILAANGGVMRVADVKGLLRGWRPGTTGRNVIRPGRFNLRTNKYEKPVYGTDPSELHFSYLFNAYYGHITENYDWAGPRRHYSVGAYMWRPFKNRAAISALGRARLRALAAQAAAAGVSLEPEVVESSAEAA